MKNIGPERDRKIISNNPQKGSFISMYSKAEAQTTHSPKAPALNRDSLSSNQFNNRINKVKLVGEQRQSNLSVEEQYSKNLPGFKIGGNVKNSFKMNANQVKQVRQSQNTGVHKTPPNSLNEKKLMNSKSASHLPIPLNGKDQQLLHIKFQNAGLNILDDYQNEQTRYLTTKISEALAANEGIEEEIRQLKYRKLILNSNSIEIMQLKAQINELKMKIKKIRDQTVKKQQSYNEYFMDKKNTTYQKNLTNFHPRTKPYEQDNKYPTLSRVPSDLNNSNQKLTSVMSNPYLGTANSEFKQKSPLYSPTLTKSRIELDNRLKRSSLPNEIKQIKLSGLLNGVPGSNQVGHYKMMKYSEGGNGKN